MSRDYLSDKDVLVVSKPLAKALGIGASIVLRRVQHWLEYNEAHKADKEKTHFRNGRWWAWNGYGGWTEDLEIFSRSTVRRLFNALEELCLLIATDEYNKRKSDQTKWYSIDYEAYDQFIELWHKHNCPMYLDGKQSKTYLTMLNEWRKTHPVHSEQPLPLSTVSRGAVHSEQGSMSTVSREPLSTVSNALPESHSESQPKRKQKKQTASKSDAGATRFEDLIKAWLDTTGIIDAAAYGKPAHRDNAKIMLEKGITPEDVREHTQEKKRDPFWNEGAVPFTEVAKTILSWKQKRSKPAAYGAEPLPTDDYYTPTAAELAHIEALKAAALERMKTNGKRTA